MGHQGYRRPDAVKTRSGTIECMLSPSNKTKGAWPCEWTWWLGDFLDTQKRVALTKRIGIRFLVSGFWISFLLSANQRTIPLSSGPILRDRTLSLLHSAEAFSLRSLKVRQINERHDMTYTKQGNSWDTLLWILCINLTPKSLQFKSTIFSFTQL